VWQFGSVHPGRLPLSDLGKKTLTDIVRVGEGQFRLKKQFFVCASQERFSQLSSELLITYVNKISTEFLASADFDKFDARPGVSGQIRSLRDRYFGDFLSDVATISDSSLPDSWPAVASSWHFGASRVASVAVSDWRTLVGFAIETPSAIDTTSERCIFHRGSSVTVRHMAVRNLRTSSALAPSSRSI